MPCQIEGCEAEGKLTRGLCFKHYRRLLRTGSALVVRPPGKPGDLRKHFMYNAWAGMVNRCHNPNNTSYGRYGARGIYVCDRWRQSFAAFLEDMGERPAGLTLDRIDATGPYAPDNCRWATKKEQRTNISAESDARLRAAIGEKKRQYWANRKAANAV
jgi:hypothetical protein